MSDPLSRLGSLAASRSAPDLDAIKLRAHRIQRRRQTGLASAGAAAMAVVAVVAVLLVTGPADERSSTLEGALSGPTPTSAAQPRSLAGTVADDAEAKGPAAPGETTSTAGGSAGVSGSAPKAASPERASTDSTTARSQGQGASSVEPQLEATLEVSDQPIGRGKTFTLQVCNTTSGTVSREFGTSQRYDFEVSQGGELVWRWSDGQFFTQAVGSETWKASECKRWSADWDGSRSDGGRAPAGDYKAVGVLKARPELRTAPQPFSLTAL